MRLLNDFDVNVSNSRSNAISPSEITAQDDPCFVIHPLLTTDKQPFALIAVPTTQHHCTRQKNCLEESERFSIYEVTDKDVQLIGCVDCQQHVCTRSALDGCDAVLYDRHKTMYSQDLMRSGIRINIVASRQQPLSDILRAAYLNLTI